MDDYDWMNEWSNRNMNEYVEILEYEWKIFQCKWRNMNENFEYMKCRTLNMKWWIWMWMKKYEHEWRNMYGISLNHEWTEHEYEGWTKTKRFAFDAEFLWKKGRTSNMTIRDE